MVEIIHVLWIFLLHAGAEGFGRQRHAYINKQGFCSKDYMDGNADVDKNLAFT